MNWRGSSSNWVSGHVRKRSRRAYERALGPRGLRVPRPNRYRRMGIQADSDLWRLFPSRACRARNKVLQVSLHACQPFVRAEHLPIQPADCGEDSQQKRAIKPCVFHAVELTVVPRAWSTGSFSGNEPDRRPAHAIGRPFVDSTTGESAIREHARAGPAHSGRRKTERNDRNGQSVPFRFHFRFRNGS